MTSKACQPEDTLEEAARAVKTALGSPGGAIVNYMVTVESTSSWLKEAVRDSPQDIPSLLIADRQTRGRGTRGRQWYQAPGKDIAVSIAFSNIDFHRDSRLALLAGVYVRRAVCEVIGTRKADQMGLGIRWPNDIVAGEAKLKLGGILVERTRNCDIVGVGVNVNSQEDDFPDGIRQGTTSLRMQCGADVSRTALAVELSKSLASLAGSGTGEIEAAMAELLRVDRSDGGRYILHLPARAVQVVSVGIAEASGELICRGPAGEDYLVSSYTMLEKQQ